MFIHRHKGTIGALKRVVEPLGYIIKVTEWWQTDDPPGTFRLDEIGRASCRERVYVLV